MYINQLKLGYGYAGMLSHQYSLDNDWKIVESFNTDVNINQIKKIKKNNGKDGLFETAFVVNGKFYSFVATIKNNSANPVRFFPFDNDSKYWFKKAVPDILTDKNGKPILDKNGKPKHDIRSSAIVFSGVLKSIDMMLNYYPNLKEIVFTAAYKELKNLYKTMTYMIKKRYPEWKIDVNIGNKFIYKRKEK